jgi:hypothetical protein
LRHLEAAVLQTPRAETALFAQLTALQKTLVGLQMRLMNDEVRQKLNEPTVYSIQQRAWRAYWGLGRTRQMPTTTQRRNIEIAQAEFAALRRELAVLLDNDLAQLEAELESFGAPWTPGRRLG